MEWSDLFQNMRTGKTEDHKYYMYRKTAIAAIHDLHTGTQSGPIPLFGLFR